MNAKLETRLANLILSVEETYNRFVADFTAKMVVNPAETVVRDGKALMKIQQEFVIASELKRIFTEGQEFKATAEQVEGEVAKYLRRLTKQMLETHRWRGTSTCSMDRVNSEMMGLAICWWIERLTEILEG